MTATLITDEQNVIVVDYQYYFKGLSVSKEEYLERAYLARWFNNKGKYLFSRNGGIKPLFYWV